MNSLKPLMLAVVTTASLLAAAPAAALVWSETGSGAGDLVATAQNTGPAGEALTGITGTLDTVTRVNEDPRNEVDLFRIYISDFASFSALTLSSNPDDTALFLFDSSGFGVYTNDDNGTDLLSMLPVGGPTANGTYFLGIAIGGFIAYDASLDDLFTAGGFTDVRGADPAAGPLDSWSPGFATLAESGLSYEIVLTGASTSAVPEPATALLLMLGLSGLAARRAGLRRRGLTPKGNSQRT